MGNNNSSLSSGGDSYCYRKTDEQLKDQLGAAAEASQIETVSKHSFPLQESRLVNQTINDELLKKISKSLNI